MKISVLMTGADSDYAIERPYQKYLAQQPGIISLKFFPAQNIFLNYYRKSIFHKLIYRLGLSRILHKVNKDLLILAQQFKPDVLLVFKGMEIFPSTLRALKSNGVMLVNYNPDNPFVFSGRGSGNRNVSDSVKLFDLYISYDRHVCKRLYDKFHIASALLPFGYEVNLELFDKCRLTREFLKTCFIGNPDIHRIKFLNNLAAKGIGIDVYGSDWDKIDLHGNISVKGYATDSNMWIQLRRYRVQLNLMRPHNPDSHNMRSFEIPAIGGIQLAPATSDHMMYFEVGKEIFVFENIEDCTDKIKMLLALNEKDAMILREQARNRCLHSGYSYENRAASLSSLLIGLFSAEAS